MADPLTWVSIASTVVGFVGKMQAGNAASAAGERQRIADKFQADQMERQAGQEVAASQRKAQEERERAQMLASRAVALAGGGSTDPSVVNLLADIQGTGAYNAAVRLYEGESRAQQLRTGAAGKLYEGEMAAIGGQQKRGAYMTSAFGSAAGTGATLFDRYGGGGPRVAAAGSPGSAGDIYSDIFA